MTGEPLSPRNQKITRLRRLLRRRSLRAEEGVLVVEGPSMLDEALDAGLAVESVFVEEHAPRAMHELAARSGAPVHLVADGAVEGIADLTSPPPMLSVVERPRVRLADVLARRPDGSGLVLVLAGVGDPGNAGTLIRSAEAAGATGVISTVGSVDLTNPKVVRAAAGSLFRLPVWADATVSALSELAAEGWQVVGTAADAPVSHEGAEWAEAVALVLGSEAHGVPADVAGLVDTWVRVPMAGRVESLNVAVTGTLVAFEATRRHRDLTGGPPEAQGERLGRSDGESDLAGTDRAGRVAP